MSRTADSLETAGPGNHAERPITLNGHSDTRNDSFPGTGSKVPNKRTGKEKEHWMGNSQGLPLLTITLSWIQTRSVAYLRGGGTVLCNAPPHLAWCLMFFALLLKQREIWSIPRATWTLQKAPFQEKVEKHWWVRGLKHSDWALLLTWIDWRPCRCDRGDRDAADGWRCRWCALTNQCWRCESRQPRWTLPPGRWSTASRSTDSVSAPRRGYSALCSDLYVDRLTPVNS